MNELLYKEEAFQLFGFSKAVENLTDSHIKQVLNYLAALETSPLVCWSILEAIPRNVRG
jgi:hypothetical protein